MFSLYDDLLVNCGLLQFLVDSNPGSLHTNYTGHDPDTDLKLANVMTISRFWRKNTDHMARLDI